jgi:hypothetical protein
MDENPGLSEQYRTASPWPLFVALGIPISELGILFDIFPLSVGGLLLFCGSVAGMATESGYASSPWRALAALGVVCLATGAALAFPLALQTRGYAVVAAAVLLMVGAVVGELFLDEPPSPV